MLQRGAWIRQVGAVLSIPLGCLAESDALLMGGALPKPAGPPALARCRVLHEALHPTSCSRMVSEMQRLSQQVPLSLHRQVVAFKHGKVHRLHDDQHRTLKMILRHDAGRAESLTRDHVASIRGAFGGGPA